MKRIFLLNPDNSGSGLYRAQLPFKHCRGELESKGIALEMPAGLDWERNYDAYIFHRFISPQFFPYLSRLKDRGKKIVWELDDNLFSLPESNPAKAMVQPHDLEGLRICLEWADAIIVSTEPLKKQLGFPEKTTVLPNLLDRETWKEPTFNKIDQQLRIIWAGSNTHKADLEIIEQPLRQCLSDSHKFPVKLIMFGDCPESLKDHKDVLYIEHVNVHHYPKMLKMLQPHIAACPLVDNDFNRAKSAIKYYEMTLAGATVCASQVGPYKGLIDYVCYDIDTGKTNWSELPTLISAYHAPMERRHWQGCWETVWENHTWTNATKRPWMEFFENLVS